PRQQLLVQDVAGLVCGIARDADRADPVLETRPHVLGRLAHIIRIRQAILIQGSATAAGLAIPAPVPRLPPAVPPAASPPLTPVAAPLTSCASRGSRTAAAPRAPGAARLPPPPRASFPVLRAPSRHRPGRSASASS